MVAVDAHPTPQGAGPPITALSSAAARLAWTSAGMGCVTLGGIGIVVPGLPTTIFFILAAGCFTRSSPRLEAWVLGLPKIGPAVADYRAGRGMPRRAKVMAVSMIAVFVSLSAWMIPTWWVKAAVVVAGIIGTTVVLRVPTKDMQLSPGQPAPPRPRDS